MQIVKKYLLAPAFILLVSYNAQATEKYVELFDEESSNISQPAETEIPDLLSESINDSSATEQSAETITSDIAPIEVENNSPIIDTLEKNIEDTTAETSENSEAKNYLGSYIADIEEKKNARHKAREILNHKPTILQPNQKIVVRDSMKETKEIAENPSILSSQTNPAKNASQKEEKQTTENKIELIKQKHPQAPFGLYWGASYEETKELGFKTKQASRENYTNVYQIINPQQKLNTFSQVIAIYGDINQLWCVYTKGQPLDDTPSADKALALYKQYYTALEKKYGNAQEFFTPYTYEEEIVTGEGDNKISRTEQKQTPMGGANFLNELQNGKATLYATFNDEKYGVTLGVSVDRKGKSYISIDYKDLTLLKKNQDTILTNMISDI